MAEDFCQGRLILYPSEAALRTVVGISDKIKGEKAVKCWLEEHVRPVLEHLVKNGTVNENSVIFVDNYVGTRELSYRIENMEERCRSTVAKKFKNWAADIRRAYEKGKYLEQCIGFLIEKLHGFSGEVTPLSASEAREELITIARDVSSAAIDLKSAKEALASPVWETDGTTKRALSAATDLKSVKEALGSQVGETDDKDRVNKRLKTQQEALCSAMECSSGCPEIITRVAYDLKLCRSSPASFILLGLRDDGKKELLSELVRYIANDGMVKIFAMDMSEYSDEGALFRLRNSPLRTFTNDNEYLDIVEAVRKHPNSIFYFDKIEKAHITVYGFLLALLCSGVLVDDLGNEVDFRKTIVIFSSDCGNKRTFAHLAGHDGEVNSMSDAGSEQEKQGKQGGWLRFELLCKVDKLLFCDPFAAHQLGKMRSYQVEDLRRWAVGSDCDKLSGTFSLMFKNGKLSEPLLKLLDRLGSDKERMAERRAFWSQKWLPGWQPSLAHPFFMCNVLPVKLSFV